MHDDDDNDKLVIGISHLVTYAILSSPSLSLSLFLVQCLYKKYRVYRCMENAATNMWLTMAHAYNASYTTMNVNIDAIYCIQLMVFLLRKHDFM